MARRPRLFTAGVLDHVIVRGNQHFLFAYRLSDVAAYFGRDIATLATLLARLSDRMQANDKVRREVDQLIKIVEL